VARIVTFGEIMARMAPPGLLRLQQVLPGSLDATFAGAEANVAASLALLGSDAEFVTALPDSPLTQPCLASLRSWGVGTANIRLTEAGRFGVYFVEMGANQRPTRVFYDRDFSAISLATPADFEWKRILKDAEWFHVTSITAALSKSAAETTLEAVRTAHRMGVNVSCDINYRSKLWRWDSARTPLQLAGDVVRQMLPFVSLMVGNEEDAKLAGVPIETSPGMNPADRTIRLARAFREHSPQLKYFAATFREQISATHNNWGGCLLNTDSDEAHLAPWKNGEYQPYEIRNIVDRVGSGDAFDAGLLYGMTTAGFDLQSTVEFATAASCLAHSVVGDTNYATRAEIEELMAGSSSGRVVR
jgi:2-dehydro-3-deoxygluconokinase